MLEVCKRRCDECLFSKNKIVSDTRKASILRTCAKKDTHFYCHKSGPARKVICAGFYQTKTSQLIRIARRLGSIVFVHLESPKS